MKREYFMLHVLGKLYAVKYHDGNYDVTVYEGNRDECLEWMEKNS